jgi:hypothetical protein
MIQTYLEHSDIIVEQPSLADRLHSTQSNFSDTISKSYTEMILDIKNKNYDMRKLGNQISIYNGTATTSGYSDVSIEDFVNMSTLVLDVSDISITDNYTITLYGCDESDGTFTEITKIHLDSVGTYKMTFFDYYKFYKVHHSGNSVTPFSITYKAMLIENIYFYLHLYKTLNNIYSTLGRDVDDYWESKSMQYLDKYSTLLNNGIFYIDADDDKVISEEDSFIDTRSIRIVL